MSRPGGQRSLGVALRLQVPIHEIDLLLATKALTYVLSPDLADPIDGLQLAICGGEQLLESPELGHDPLDDELGQPWYAPENAESTRRHRVVEGIELAVVAQQLGEPTKIQDVGVRQPHELVERRGE